MNRAKLIGIAAAAALAGAAPAQAQLGGLLPGVPRLPGVAAELPLDEAATPARRLSDPAEGLLGGVRGLPESALSELRRRTVERLLREHPRAVEADEAGQPVVRGEVVALAPSAAALALAQAAGFRIARRTALEGLGLETVVLSPPRGLSARAAVRRLRELDPEGQYDFNHLYQASGTAAATGPAAHAAPAAGGAGADVRLGLVDGSVAASHPALRRARITQKAFAPGGARTTDHATAVASLMAGAAGPFRGAAPGADLYVADVYGPTPQGGSAEAIARGLSWLAQNRVSVVNISLVGPPNRLLGAAVQAATGRGMTVVAAVGNDGPAAPPLYPAAYPNVVAVTAVDARRRALPEAGRGAHVDFAAPGADMAAAGAKGGWLAVRGTSFAAPLVAGMIAREGAPGLSRQAADLGAPGPDHVYGRGLVAADLRTEPARVGARALALRGP